MTRPSPGPRLCSTGLLSAALALCLPCAGAGAATVTVTDCGDSGLAGQLRHAISTAAPGDTIQLPGCAIVLTGAPGDDANLSGDLDVAGTLTIRGLGPTATILDGGGVDRVLHVLPGATVTIEDLTVRNGRSPDGAEGGGILSAGTLTLSRVTVTGNTTTGFADGGGIASMVSASLTATDVEVSDNSGDDAGGIKSEGLLVLTRARVVGNRAADDRGGIAVDGSPGPVVVTDSTIAGNISGSRGGGMEFRSGATGTFTRTTFFGNSAREVGGGLIVSINATLALTNCTIAHNTSGGGGGGIRIEGASTVSLVNSTVARNTDTSGLVAGAGGIDKDTGTLILANTIVALNTAGPGTANADVGPADIDTSTSSLVGGEPRLGPLQDNGGPTFTMAPFPGSPAVDAGSNAAAAAAGLATDQRGVPRLQDGDGNDVATVDIGAVEIEPAPGGLLAISPPSGTYAAPERFAVSLILRAPGRTLDPAGATAALDGTDVTARLAPCLAPAVIPDGGRVFRCGALADARPASRAGLPPGTHTLAVTLLFTDGSTVAATAVWEVLAITE